MNEAIAVAVISGVVALVGIVLKQYLDQRSRPVGGERLTEAERERLRGVYRNLMDSIHAFKGEVETFVSTGQVPQDEERIDRAAQGFVEAAQEAQLGSSQAVVDAMVLTGEAMKAVLREVKPMGRRGSRTPGYTASIVALDQAAARLVQAARRDLGTHRLD